MQVVRVTDDIRKKWDEFVSTHATDGGILQSWLWGDFQKALGRPIFRLAEYSREGDLVAVALLVKQEIHFDYNYLYCPRGPVINTANFDDASPFFSEIKALAREQKSFLVRVDPAWTIGSDKRLLDADFRKTEKEVQPKCSLIIDITKSEDELLGGMKQKTRYNLNLATKKPVVVRVSSEIADVEPFWQLMKQTAKRDGIRSHPKEYYKKMFELLSPDGTAQFFIAQYDNKIVAVNMVTFFGTTCTYLHGTSADLYRGVMAPYLLQWHAIVEAKKRGIQWYDFGGVNAHSFQDQRWAGITRFKTGFVPDQPPTEFVGGFEAVINPVIYSAYTFIKQIRG